MKKLLGLFALSFISINLSANDADIAKLDAQVAQQVQQIEYKTGILATAVEEENIKGDIVFDEMLAIGLTVEQAVEKYELTPTTERYLILKMAMRESSDGIHPCPCP